MYLQLDKRAGLGAFAVQILLAKCLWLILVLIPLFQEEDQESENEKLVVKEPEAEEGKL